MIFINRSSVVKSSCKFFTHATLMAGLLFGMLTLGVEPVKAADRQICNPGNGTSGAFRGLFYSYYEGSSQNDRWNCDVKFRIYDDGSRHFRIDWDQNQTWGEDVVGGMGWTWGWDRRKIGYNFGEFTSNAGTKAIAGVYGWTCGSRDRNRYPNTAAQEYYIVDTWSGSGNFVPWDENRNAPANPIRKNGRDVIIDANGGKYKVYKVRRNGAQYCGNGSARGFDQFWSVRTSSLSTGVDRGIDFANHDNVWDDYGFSSNRVRNGYQIVMGEAFGHANFRHKGAVDGTAWAR